MLFAKSQNNTLKENTHSPASSSTAKPIGTAVAESNCASTSLTAPAPGKQSSTRGVATSTHRRAALPSAEPELPSTARPHTRAAYCCRLSARATAGCRILELPELPETVDSAPPLRALRSRTMKSVPLAVPRSISWSDTHAAAVGVSCASSVDVTWHAVMLSPSQTARKVSERGGVRPRAVGGAGAG